MVRSTSLLLPVTDRPSPTLRLLCGRAGLLPFLAPVTTLLHLQMLTSPPPPLPPPPLLRLPLRQEVEIHAQLWQEQEQQQQ